MKPILSIIVPFYNVEEYFEDFLTSLLPINDNYEVILVNDGTKDKSRDIALKFISKYKNVVLVDKENGGLSSARNFGFNKANGEYVIFFDSDDYIENKLVISEMLQKAITTNSDIVVAPYYEFTDLNHKKYRYDKVNFSTSLDTLDSKLDPFYNNNLSFAVWNKLFNTEFLHKSKLVFKEGIWFEDLEFIFRAFYFASKVSKVNNILLGYRQRKNSIMKTISPKILDKIFVCDSLIKFLESQNSSKENFENFKIIYLRMTFSVIFTIITSNCTSSEKKYYLEKIFHHEQFKLNFKGKLNFKNNLSKSEYVLYLMIKYKIINEKNINRTSFFKIFR